jgi:iron complex outermembrane receptor protein
MYSNLGWQIDQKTQARADIIYVNAAEQLPGALTYQQFVSNARQADPTNLQNNWGRYQNAIHVDLDVTHRLGDSQELEFIAYGRYRKLYHPIYQILDQDTRTFGGELRYRYFGNLFGHQDHFVIGFAPQTGTQGQRKFQNVLGQPGALAARFGDRATNWSFYFDNQLDVHRGLTFVVGGRGDLNYRRYDDHFLSDGNQSDKRRYNSFSPKVGFTWAAAESVQVFGNVSRSYEAPLLFELTSFGAPGFLPLRAQDTWQYELGTRGHALERLNWDVAIFDLEVRNELMNINLVPFPGAHFTFPSYRNSPRTRHMGLELGGSTDLKKGLFSRQDRLTWRNAYTFARYTFRGDPSYGNNWLPGQPRHLVRSELRYEHPAGFWLAPNLDWSPETYFVDSANTATNFSYAVMNVKAGYDLHALSFFVEAANLVDKNYSASVQVDAADLRFYEPANRRSAFGGVRWSF